MDRREKIRAQASSIPRRNLLAGEAGAELLELALVLPILLVLLVGILDFGQAWSLKDKLAGAARDATRVAVANFNDTNNPQCQDATPCSVQAAASAAVASLKSDPRIDTCGMDPSTTTPSAGTFTWTYTSGSGCASPLTITVERAVPEVVNGTTTLCTRVTLSYPYNWTFANVAGLLGGSFFTNPIMISSADTMANLN